MDDLLKDKLNKEYESNKELFKDIKEARKWISKVIKEYGKNL